MDDIARWVASPVSRRRALKLGAGAFAGMAIFPLRPHTADPTPGGFPKPGDIICADETKDCRGWTCPGVSDRYPLGTTCCYLPPDPDVHIQCKAGGCCNPCDPQASTCSGDGHCVPGKVPDGCCTAIGGVRCGDGCCSAGLLCCHRFFTLKQDSCCTREEQLKGNCKDMKHMANIAAGVIGLVGFVAGDGLGLALGVAAAATFFASEGADLCADDPPDADFKAIFVPTVPRLPRLHAGNHLTPRAVRALSAMSTNYVRYGAYTIAWIRSIEKAQGAAQANDTQWAKRHRAAAATYARTAARALERDHGLRSTARRELQRAGFRRFKITSAQVLNWQRHIKTHGLPTQMEGVLREANVSAGRRQALRHDLLQVDPKAIADLGLFGELDDARFQQATTAMVQSMRQSADSLSTGA